MDESNQRRFTLCFSGVCICDLKNKKRKKEEEKRNDINVTAVPPRSLYGAGE